MAGNAEKNDFHCQGWKCGVKTRQRTPLLLSRFVFDDSSSTASNFHLSSAGSRISAKELDCSARMSHLLTILIRSQRGSRSPIEKGDRKVALLQN
jgi:hypothetical protein